MHGKKLSVTFVYEIIKEQLNIMKANKIFTEQNYNDAKQNTNVTTFQNINHCYIRFGTYGATVFYLRNNKIKIINNWRMYDYKDLCNKFDSAEFED